MRYSEVLTTLQNLTNKDITQAELSRVLNIKQSAMSNRQTRDSKFSNSEIAILENHYDVILHNNLSQLGDIIKIPYWDELPSALKIPDFTCVTAERKVIEKHWYLNPDSLCIVPMIGDKMTNYWYPIRNGDILIVDTSQDYIMGNGVYFATSQNNTRFWVREMQMLVNDDIEFKGFSPSGNTTKILSKKQLQDVNFKIIGKVIKNVSFRL